MASSFPGRHPLVRSAVYQAASPAERRARAARIERRYGRAPSQRELAQLAQASNFATRKSKEGARGTAQLHAGWADKLALCRAAQQALALAQQGKSTWTRADLVSTCPAPAGTRRRPPGCWRRRRTGSCARSPIRSCVWKYRSPPGSRALLRADGRSVHRRHGGVRYATRAQS